MTQLDRIESELALIKTEIRQLRDLLGSSGNQKFSAATFGQLGNVDHDISAANFRNKNNPLYDEDIETTNLRSKDKPASDNKPVEVDPTA